MRKSLLCALVLLLLTHFSYTQESATYAQTLKKMFEVSGTENTYKTIISQMFGMFKQQYNQVDSTTWNEMEGEFKQASLNDLAEMLVPVYGKHLTESDLEAVNEFYQSPTGQKFAEKTPLITQESMQIGQTWGQQIATEFIRKMEERGYK